MELSKTQDGKEKIPSVIRKKRRPPSGKTGVGSGWTLSSFLTESGPMLGNQQVLNLCYCDIMQCDCIEPAPKGWTYAYKTLLAWGNSKE